VSFEIIKINNVTYEEFNNLLVYNSLRDKLFENNDIMYYTYWIKGPSSSQLNNTYLSACLNSISIKYLPIIIFFVQVFHDGRILTSSHSKALSHYHHVLERGWFLFSNEAWNSIK